MTDKFPILVGSIVGVLSSLLLMILAQNALTFVEFESFANATLILQTSSIFLLSSCQNYVSIKYPELDFRKLILIFSGYAIMMTVYFYGYSNINTYDLLLATIILVIFGLASTTSLISGHNYMYMFFIIAQQTMPLTLFLAIINYQKTELNIAELRIYVNYALLPIALFLLFYLKINIQKSKHHWVEVLLPLPISGITFVKGNIDKIVIPLVADMHETVLYFSCLIIANFTNYLSTFIARIGIKDIRDSVRSSVSTDQNIAKRLDLLIGLGGFCISLISLAYVSFQEIVRDPYDILRILLINGYITAHCMSVNTMNRCMFQENYKRIYRAFVIPAVSALCVIFMVRSHFPNDIQVYIALLSFHILALLVINRD